MRYNERLPKRYVLQILPKVFPIKQEIEIPVKPLGTVIFIISKIMVIM